MRLQLLTLSISTGVSILITQPLLAQTSSLPQPSTAPLELSLLEAAISPNNRFDVTNYQLSCGQSIVITPYTICQRELTIPSLWWANEQFAGETLNNNWLAYPGEGNTPGRIDLVVNRQSWSLLDYLERYEFVNQFGTVARDYGYNVRVFNYQKELLATYTCNFSTSPEQCNINVQVAGKARVRGSTGMKGLP